MELTSSRKYTKNTSTCGTIHKEHLLNTGRRPQTSKSAKKSPCNWEGQKQSKKKRKESRQDLYPREGAMKEERFLHPGRSPHWQGDEPGQRGSFRALEENAATGLQKTKQRVTCTDDWYQGPALPSLRCLSTGVGGGWILKLGLQRSDRGEDWGWLRGDSLKGLECGNWGCMQKKPKPNREARRHCWGAQEERCGTAIGGSFPACALRQKDTANTNVSSGGGHELPLPLQAPETEAGHCRF